MHKTAIDHKNCKTTYTGRKLNELATHFNKPFQQAVSWTRSELHRSLTEVPKWCSEAVQGHTPSWPMTPSPFKHLASLGSPQYFLVFGSCPSCIQTSAVTSMPATALAQQLQNYVCLPLGHHLNPCHLCLFIPCQVSCQFLLRQFLLHQFLSQDTLSTYFCHHFILQQQVAERNKTHDATSNPQLSVLKVSYTVYLWATSAPVNTLCEAVSDMHHWAPLLVKANIYLRFFLLLAAWEAEKSA